jgi:hypothetical protein
MISEGMNTSYSTARAAGLLHLRFTPEGVIFGSRKTPKEFQSCGMGHQTRHGAKFGCALCVQQLSKAPHIRIILLTRNAVKARALRDEHSFICFELTPFLPYKIWPESNQLEGSGIKNRE